MDSASDQNVECNASSDAPTPKPRGVPRLFVIAAGAVVAIILVALPRQNSGRAAACAGIVAILAVAFLDWAVFHARRFAVIRIVLACLIGVGIAQYFRLTDEWAFRRAFGVEPPSAIRDLKIAGDYIGPQNDTILLLRFRADEVGFDELVSHRQFQREAEDEEWYGREPDVVWRHLFGGYIPVGGDAWRRIKPPASPRIYRWRGDRTEGTLVLWDADTGRAFAVYTFG